LQKVAEHIRKQIIETCQVNGGHLAGSLGAVEIAVALHHVFESPKDKIIWDVGHQAYAHKILTDRADRFKTIRKYKGLSGFLSRQESNHDVFGAGHSSTALSAALGISLEDSLANTQKNWTIAVVGDGAMTSGLFWEALNHYQKIKNQLGPVLFILNDNQMSISENEGGLAHLIKTGMFSKMLVELGFKTPDETTLTFDGHDLQQLVSTFKKIKSKQGHYFIHLKTQKGRGLLEAETYPEKFHGISPYSSSTTITQKKNEKNWSQAFGEVLVQKAAEDPRLVAICAAMKDGVGLNEFSEIFSKRFFDVGIAESHAVTFAAGLATQNIKPIVAIYSTFLQRAIDQIIHDVALQRLSVFFAVDRAGIVGADGPTHHGVFDLVYFGMIPGFEIAIPQVYEDMNLVIEDYLKSEKIVAMRYPRGVGKNKTDVQLQQGLRTYHANKNSKLLFIVPGPAVHKFQTMISTHPLLKNITTLVSPLYIKPTHPEIEEWLAQNPQASIITFEEGVVDHGWGVQLRKCDPHFRPWLNLGYPGEHFIPHGTVSELETYLEINAAQLETKILNFLNNP
jgi:1-deoxy-D-xylulose-5-phosphate synthase